MHQQSEPTGLRAHRFEVPCAVHGHHVYYLVGTDHGADDAAFYLLRTLKRNGHDPSYNHCQLDHATLDRLLFATQTVKGFEP